MKKIRQTIEQAERKPTWDSTHEAFSAIRAFKSTNAEDGTKRLAALVELITIIEGRLKADNRRAVRKVGMNPVPPEASGMPPGVSPEAITDPKLRKIYEKTLAEHARSAEFWYEHHRMEGVLRSATSSMAGDVLEMFGISEEAEAKLQAFLNTAKFTAETVKGIVEQYRHAAKLLRKSNPRKQ